MKLASSTAGRLDYLAVGDAYVHLARLPGGTIEMNSRTKSDARTDRAATMTVRASTRGGR